MSTKSVTGRTTLQGSEVVLPVSHRSFPENMEVTESWMHNISFHAAHIMNLRGGISTTNAQSANLFSSSQAFYSFAPLAYNYRLQPARLACNKNAARNRSAISCHKRPTRCHSWRKPQGVEEDGQKACQWAVWWYCTTCLCFSSD